MGWGLKVSTSVAVPEILMTFPHSGVLYHQKAGQENFPPEKQYIHKVQSHDGVDMIITMLPFLANQIHDTDTLLHDNTYKCVFGNEWEAVILDKQLNTSKSLTILDA